MIFEKPVQVCFLDDDDRPAWGIGYQDEIICACCGSTFDPEEVEVLKIYPDWVDFSESIGE